MDSIKIADFWKEKEKDIIIHENGKMNVIESCIDRHALENPEKIALHFEDETGKTREYSYLKLENEVNQFANYFESIELKKKSRVFIFLPKIAENYISFLATIKQGSIAAPLFEAFQTEGLELRLERGDADLLITNLDLLKRLKNENKFKKMKIIIVDSPEFKEKLEKQEKEFKANLKNKEETAIMMFTSSTAGTPVAGIEISHYALVQQHFTSKLVLDLNKEDKYWCTAHPGWITGAVYGILSALSIGCSNYVYTGHFDSKVWINFIKKNKISVIYTAPTALRMLKEAIKKSDFESVRNICSVGEALTSSLYDFYKNIGIEINDTYWQTEAGAIIIANTPAIKKKSGSMGKAIPGVDAKIVDGIIMLKPTWPALMTGIYKHKKMYEEYFEKGLFKTNDLAKQDSEGYFFFVGRKDDIIKTSGERVSPIEIESILMKHNAVKEVAVIGIPDKIKGAIIKAFIILSKDIKESEELKEELSQFVKKNYAGHAYPKVIQFVKEMPKTNSGKIIRMKLREMEKK